MKFPSNPDFLVFFVNTSLSPTDGRYHDCTHIFRKDEDAVREYLAKRCLQERHDKWTKCWSQLTY